MIFFDALPFLRTEFFLKSFEHFGKGKLARALSVHELNYGLVSNDIENIIELLFEIAIIL